MKRVFPVVALAVACILAGLPDVEAGEFERENLRHYPPHESSRWFRALKSNLGNVDSVLAWMSQDSSVQAGMRSIERYDAELWVREHFMLADAEGWVHSNQEYVDAHRRLQVTKTPTSVQSPSTWRNIGPFTWDREAVKETGSEGIGVLRSIAAHSSTPDVLLVGTISAGVWRSADAGKHWTPVADHLNAQQADDVEFAPSDPRVAYVALDVGLAMSTDAGQTFAMTSLDSRDDFPYSKPVSLVSVHPTNPDEVVVAYNKALYRSVDAGQTWTMIPNSEGTYWSVRYAPSGNFIYAVRTRNHWSEFVRFGTNGIEYPTGLPVQAANSIIPRGLVATSPAAPQTVWVMYGGQVDSIGGVWGLYKSVDEGRSFTHVCCGNVNGPEPPGVNNPNLFDYSANGTGLGQITWDMAFSVSNVDTSVMVAAGIFPWVSTNGGRNWTKTSPIHYDVQDALILDTTLWVCTDGGLQRSDDLGKSMVDRSEGICAVEVWGFGQSPLNNVMALGAYHLPIFIRDDEVYDSRSYEGGWYPWSGADAMLADVNPDDDSWLYVKPWSSVRAKRYDDITHPPMSRELGIDLGYLPFSNVAFHPNRTYSIVAADHGQKRIARTDDNAESWYSVKTFTNSVIHVRIAPSHPQTMAVVADARLWYTENGTDWTDITPPTSISNNSRVVDVAIDPQDHLTLWIVFGGWQTEAKVATSNDGGLTWNAIVDGLRDQPLNCIAVRPAGTERVIVGSTSGAFVLNELGDGFVELGVGLPRCGVYFIQPDETQALLRIGTTRGLWEMPLSPGKPRAQISVSSDTVRCYSDEVRYTDRSSTFLNSSSWRRWSFPGGTPATSTERQPLVQYSAPGIYDALLTVGNSYGTDSTVLLSSVTVLPSECDVVDPRPGGCVDLGDPDDFATLGQFSGSTRTFTFTAWVKPRGEQPSFSAILCTDAVNDYKGEVGMQIVDVNNEIGYLWTDGQWWWKSGLHLTADQWNHVALIVDADRGVTVMVNGVPSHNGQSAVEVDLSKLVFTLGTYHYWSSRNLDAQIDEVRLYRTALSVDAIRKSMHHPVDPDDENILGWYQFNEKGGTTFYSAHGNVHGTPAAGAHRVASTIPYGPGSTDTTRLPAGDPEIIPTLGINARVSETTGNGIQLTTINLPAPFYTGSPQLLQPRYFGVQSLTDTAHTLESVTMDLHGLIGWEDARARSFHVKSVVAYDSSWDWTDIPATVYHNSQAQQVTFKFTPAIPARTMLCISVDGGPVSVADPVATFSVGPVPAHDLLRIRGVIPSKVYSVLDAFGRMMVSVTAGSDEILLPVSAYPSGMYLITSDGTVVTVPIVH